ncbi:MAG: hypothetical protein KAJ66_02775 [Candidatus Omnitrophica bacterium]|nr:hypothetical protein [Candidatus Omnitrophota bacterium]
MNKRLICLAILFGLVLGFAIEADAGWYDSAWPYRVKVTILASEVDTDVTDYSIYVNLSNLPAGFHAHVNQSDASDIRVTKVNGATELPREVGLAESK